MSRMKGATAWPWLVPLLVTAVVFVPGLGGTFLFDDMHVVAMNPAIRLAEPGLAGWWAAITSFHQGTRPLAMFTFALNFAASGAGARGFLIGNLILHLCNLLLVIALVRLLLQLAPRWSSARSPWLASIVGLAWACHPLQVSTVLYVVQRMEMLASTFTLAALLLYCHGRQRQHAVGGHWGWIAAAVVTALLGLLAKETAVQFLLLALLLEWSFFRFRGPGGASAKGLRNAYAAVGVVVVVVIASLLPRMLHGDLFPPRDFTPYERVMTQFRVLPMYLGQMLWPAPTRLTFFYDQIAVSTGWLSPWTTLAGALLIATLAFSAAWLRARRPLYAMGVWWFLACHAFSSSVLPLEMAFEHRNYLALLGIVVAVLDLVGQPDARARRLAPAVIGCALLALLLTTVLRAGLWGQPLAQSASWHADNPGSAQAAFTYASRIQAAAGNNPQSRLFLRAIEQYDVAARNPRSSPLADALVVVLGAEAGTRATDAAWQRLVGKLRARTLGPEEQNTVNTVLVYAVSHPGRLPNDRLQEVLQVSIQKDPANAARELQYSQFAHWVLRDDALSLLHLQRALRIDGSAGMRQSQRVQAVEEGRLDAVSMIDALPSTAPRAAPGE